MSYDYLKNSGSFIPGIKQDITTLAAHYLESKSPGSTSSIKMQNVNNLYNKIKNSNNYGGSFPISNFNHNFKHK
jgi:hypothetical protein